MTELYLIAMGQVLQNQTAIMCALNSKEESEIGKAILDKNVKDSNEIMAVLKYLLDNKPEEKEDHNADTQDQAE